MTGDKTYIDNFNICLRQYLDLQDKPIAIGENIDVASRISGMTKDIESVENIRIVNTPNTELTHCGIGFGIAATGGSVSLFCKQLDFLLLALDQLANTHFLLKNSGLRGTFNIISFVCDQGFQGPQSSINNLSDFFSLSAVDIYCLDNVIGQDFDMLPCFNEPGVRIYALSQRCCKKLPQKTDVLAYDSGKTLCQFTRGKSGTILCFNFGLNHLLEKIGLDCFIDRYDLFSINYSVRLNLNMVLESLTYTRSLIIVDDSKSISKFSDKVLADLMTAAPMRFEVKHIIRPQLKHWVNDDEFLIDETIFQPIE